MRNPLLLVPRNQSRETDTNKGAIEPVPESYEGTNNPYRGIEAHGVDPTETPRDPVGWAEGVPVVYEDEQQPTEVVPVEIVSGTRELKRVRFFHAYATTPDAKQVVGLDESRSKVSIKNLGASTVYIGNEAVTAGLMHGWPLAQNESKEFTDQDELYAWSSHATDAMPLAVIVEYAVKA